MELKEDKQLEMTIPSSIIKAYNYFQENMDPEKLNIDILLKCHFHWDFRAEGRGRTGHLRYN